MKEIKKTSHWEEQMNEEKDISRRERSQEGWADGVNSETMSWKGMIWKKNNVIWSCKLSETLMKDQGLSQTHTS